MSIEAIAVLVAGAGIVATCTVQYVVVGQQIRASDEQNKVQLKEQQHALTKQFEEQNAAAERTFQFQLNESRRARVVMSYTETLHQIKEISKQIELQGSRLGNKDEDEINLGLAAASLQIPLATLCRDLENREVVRDSATAFMSAVVTSAKGQTEMLDQLIDLMNLLQRSYDQTLTRLEAVDRKYALLPV